MGRETRLFKSEETKSRPEVSAFLRQLADRIDTGQVTLRRGSDDLKLQIPATLVLDVQAEDEDKGARGIQHSLEVEIKWFDDNGDTGPSRLELG